MVIPPVTIAFVPREVFSTTRRALETLYQRTREPFELVCVDGGSPPNVQAYLEQAAREKGFKLLRTEQYLTPNQARNLAVQHVRSRYVVFVDNDALVSEGWLKPLVDCAEETGAWVVGPLYFEHAPEQHRIHMAGGICRLLQETDGRRYYLERHHHQHTLLSEIDEAIERHETELIEFHTVLVAMEAFRQLGPLDEGLLSHAEHGDLCLTVRQSGGRVFLEPRSRITYIPPKRLEPADREFFELRWSEAWAAASLDRFLKKWELSAGHPETVEALNWVRQHRRYGSVGLARLRTLLGRRPTSWLQKRLLNRIEESRNRRRYPPQEFGHVGRPHVRELHVPTVTALKAA